MRILINMKKNISFLIFFLTLPLCLFAQREDSDSVSVEINDIKDIQVQTISVEELQAQIKKLTENVEQLAESENNLKGELFDKEQKIKEQDAIINRLEHRLLFADSIVARLSNDCLLKKYDSKNVDDAIRNFEGMYSDNLKSKFARLKTLLMEYGSYTQELEAIFNEAQNDKALGNPFTGKKQAMTYIDKIKSTVYYREVYSENWTIPYLNSVIDKSIEVIKSFDPKKSKEIHLIELIK